MNTVAVLLADGFEELEAITVIDVLRRAGCDVRILSVDGVEVVRGNHRVGVSADAPLASAAAGDFDLVVCPGGLPGATNLASNEAVRGVLRRTWESGALVGAICAGPLALSAAGLLEGRRFTIYPGNEDKVEGGTWTGADVEEDDRVITSRGPGTALAFALHLAERLAGASAASDLGKRMLVE